MITENPRTGGFILSEANGHISRETVKILNGEDLPAGQVLGKVTASGNYVAYDSAATDGSETAAGVLYAATKADGADVEAVAIVRHAEVKTDELTGSDAAALADLAVLQIIAR